MRIIGAPAFHRASDSGTPTRAISRDGDVLGGQMATLLILPQRGIVVSVLSNVSYAKTHTIAVRIAEGFAD